MNRTRLGLLLFALVALPLGVVSVAPPATDDSARTMDYGALG